MKENTYAAWQFVLGVLNIAMGARINSPVLAIIATIVGAIGLYSGVRNLIKFNVKPICDRLNELEGGEG